MSTRSAAGARRAAIRRAGRNPLPALMLRQRPSARRDEPRPVSVYFVFTYLLAVGLGCAAVGCIFSGLGSRQPRLVEIGVALGVGSVLEWRLARELRHFSRWGWYGVMVELAAAFAVTVWMILRVGVGAFWGLILVVPWMLHFWQTRHHYDIGDL